ncbi:bifunctional DNA primase/polymerase [Streptomyces carpaticus]|uniref:bifunctional DNA primase/polymerase n=1 Tax=Streptomyces carpaticus TaxID=285558 RepID=UPI0031F926A0
MNSTPDLRAAAHDLHAAGLCVLPVKDDGTKAPAVPKWTQYKTVRSTPEEHDAWFSDRRRTGIGVVYGSVSGVEMLEFEGRAITEGVLEEVSDVMEASGLGDVWDTITTGWVTESPSGGLHFRVRIEGAPIPPNTKLAARLAREDEYTAEEHQRLAEKPNGKRPVRVLIETRGEGGYGVVEPSHGTVHTTGQPYTRSAGGPDNIPTIPADAMEAVRDICRMMDTVPKPEPAKTAPRDARPLPEGQLRPGDDFEARAAWTDILAGHFTPTHTSGRTTYWRREGKTSGVSATTGHAADRDRLFVFSSSTEFQQEVPYSKFGAYALLNHGGDHRAAAAELRQRGYGTPPPVRRLSDRRPTGSGRHLQAVHGATALDVEPEHEDAPDLYPVPDGKPALDITNEADAIDGLLDIMASGQLPDLYKRSTGPCWVYADDQGNPLVRQLGNDNLRAYLADHVDTYRVMPDPITEGTKEERELLAPKTCGTVLGRRDWPLPHLRGIVTAPVVRPDGSIIQAPGYDTATGLFLHPRVPLRRLAPEVSADSLARARAIVLDQMLADFPWVAPSDRAHFLGALLTPVLRPYFHGPTPMFVITATSPGSGKSLLKDILEACYGISSTPWPENDTELRKSITTQLYTTGQPVVVLDNLPNGFVIKSPILSSLLTAVHWGDRVLGSTASVTMPNDRLWVATGNGLRTGGDNGRRVLWVRLDPDCPDPDQRDGYTVGDLRPWLRKNSSTVVAALVTMVRAWLAANAPTVRVRKGDYSEWASMLAGLLAFLEVPGWMADRGDSIEQDDETQEWAAFLTAWREKVGDGAVATGAVIAAVGDLVPRLKNGDAPSPNVLGGWLKARQGRYFGTHKIVRVWDAHKCQNTWRVEAHQNRGMGQDEG